MGRQLTGMLIIALTLLRFHPHAAAQTNSQPERLLDPKVVLAAFASLTDTQIKDTADALAVIAASQEARSGDWEQIKPLLAVVNKGFLKANLWFAKPDGSYYTLEKGLTTQNLKDRPYFPKVMAGETSIGELVISRSTGGNTVITAVPIKNNGTVVGMLGASIYLQQLSERLKEALPLPKGMVFYALDPQARIALHSEEQLVYQEATTLGSPTLNEAIAQMLSTPNGVVTYDFAGGKQTAIYQTSPVTGWKLAIRFPAQGS